VEVILTWPMNLGEGVGLGVCRVESNCLCVEPLSDVFGVSCGRASRGERRLPVDLTRRSEVNSCDCEASFAVSGPLSVRVGAFVSVDFCTFECVLG